MLNAWLTATTYQQSCSQGAHTTQVTSSHQSLDQGACSDEHTLSATACTTALVFPITFELCVSRTQAWRIARRAHVHDNL